MPTPDLHPNDDGLVEQYLSARGLVGESVEESVTSSHLRTCASCSERYRRLTLALDELRDEAAREVDDLFSEERLAHQRERILRQLEAHHGHAKVLAFPVHSSPRAALLMRPGAATRWIAAAAVAGLLVGLGAGLLLEQPPGRFTLRPVDQRPAMIAERTSRAPAMRSAVRSAFDDERFLTELDDALARQTPPELRPLDVLTPRVVSVNLK